MNNPAQNPYPGDAPLLKFAADVAQLFKDQDAFFQPGVDPIWTGDYAWRLSTGTAPSIAYVESMNRVRGLFHLAPLPFPFPPAPSRAQVCSVKGTFQGASVVTPDHGFLPLWEAVTCWLTPADRQAVFALKRSLGDTHHIVSVPSGNLYNEPGQPYANFPFMDWTNGDTRLDPQFVAVIEEVILAGFIPMIFMQEERERSEKQIVLVCDALRNATVNLLPYCLLLPGWDGVFYGWSDDQNSIPAWAASARAHGAQHLGLEHNQGHIPLGEGGSDYLPGGKMHDYDVILGEFDGWIPGGVPGDTVWQILGRMVHYNRPADQPSGDDPNPPFYLGTPGPRGPWYYCAFEYDMYRWVRSQVTAAQVQQERAYLQTCGAQWVG